MPLSSATLSAIQKAGAAVFAADTQLKNATRDYADRVRAALESSPLNLSNDALIENWKTVARLSQTLAGIEEEITKVFHAASELMANGQAVQSPTPARQKRGGKKPAEQQAERPQARDSAKAKKPATKPAPRARAVVEAASSVAPATLDQAVTPAAEVGKRKKKTAKPVKPVKTAKRAAQTNSLPAISGNAAKLLNYLERILNTQDFSALSQTLAAKEIDIPLGSMTAALKKLMESGRLVAGPAGSYKLITLQAAAPQ